MSAWTGWPEKSAYTGQTGQTECRTGRPANDSKDITGICTGQDSWDRADEQDSQNMTAWTGQR